jgi:hypothetical protein
VGNGDNPARVQVAAGLARQLPMGVPLRENSSNRNKNNNDNLNNNKEFQ